MQRILLICALLAPAVQADTFMFIDAQPRSELWLNAGFFSHHF
jgi:hypothetical protein